MRDRNSESPVMQQIRRWRQSRRASPIDDKQERLSSQLIWPMRDELERSMIDLRRVIDDEVSGGRIPISRRLHPYPKGYCREITDAAFGLLPSWLEQSNKTLAGVFSEFKINGGALLSIWGELDGKYFQNAIQIGDLYLDVANDTVDLLKPKVEIAPLAVRGFRSISDIDHYARIARVYWGGAVYPNTVFPRLSPVLPIIHVNEAGYIALHPNNIQVFADNYFRSCDPARKFLADAKEQGATPPEPVANACIACIDDSGWYGDNCRSPDWRKIENYFDLAADPSGPYRSMAGFSGLIKAIQQFGGTVNLSTGDLSPCAEAGYEVA